MMAEQEPRQAQINLDQLQAEMQKSLDIFQYKKVLCIQPHPDDNEVGLGGTIAKLTASGVEVHYLTVTDGGAGTLDRTISSAQVTEIRKQEAMEVGKRLGVQQFHWLNQPDGAVFDSLDVRAKLCRVIRHVQPDVVLTVDPWLPYESHLDHVYTGRMVAHVAAASGLPYYFPEQVQAGLPVHAPKLIGFYATHAPNTTVEIDAYLPVKLAAIADHRSQFAEESLAFVQSYLTIKAIQAAEGKGFQYGESLKILPPMFLHMNVDAHSM